MVRKPPLQFLQHFLKLQKWRFFCLGKQKRRWICWNSAVVGRKIIYLEWQVIIKVFLWVWVLLWCLNATLTASHFTHPSSHSPSLRSPCLNFAKRGSNSCRLLSLCFILNIIAMNLKALLRSFLDALPHYLPQNGTCCRTPRRTPRS